jgi:hypothetical protein
METEYKRAYEIRTGMGTKKGGRTTTEDMARPVQLNLGSEGVKTPILINDDDDDKLTRISKFRDRTEKKYVSSVERPFLRLELRECSITAFTLLVGV